MCYTGSMGRKALDIIGKQFGRAVVLSRDGFGPHGEAAWLCRCDCGTEFRTLGSRLRTGRTTSCGCWKNELRQTMGQRTTLHGLSRTPEYAMWVDARKRARAHAIPFAIAVSDIRISDVCPILGIPLVSGAGIKSPNTPTLDRVNNENGYVPGNIAVISWRANKLKSDATAAELRALAEWSNRSCGS